MKTELDEAAAGALRRLGSVPCHALKAILVFSSVNML